MATISPFLRTPFTDITGGLTSHQLYGRCPRQEMVFMECLEAYGLDRGLTKCSKEFENFKECQSNEKQYKRALAMQRERYKQISAGKLKGDDRYVDIKIDSY